MGMRVTSPSWRVVRPCWGRDAGERADFALGAANAGKGHPSTSAESRVGLPFDVDGVVAGVAEEGDGGMHPGVVVQAEPVQDGEGPVDVAHAVGDQQGPWPGPATATGE
ncbi:hypothetical protein PL81_41000 [Streptomyces sp. RSD-27]|nr:hypothetical protein PL81_41000 [Streptomyces sp. RSD-27]